MPKNKTSSVPPRILAMHKHPVPLKIPTFRRSLTYLTTTTKYSCFCKEVRNLNTTTVANRPTAEEAYVALFKAKAFKEGLWTEGRLSAEEKKDLEERLKAAISQIHGVKGWNMERFWHEERVRARGLGFELNIVLEYDHENDLVPESEMVARLAAAAK